MVEALGAWNLPFGVIHPGLSQMNRFWHIGLTGKITVTFEVVTNPVLTWQKNHLATTLLMKCPFHKCNNISEMSFLWSTVAQIKTPKMVENEIWSVWGRIAKVAITFEVVKHPILTWKKNPLATTFLMIFWFQKSNKIFEMVSLSSTVGQIKTAKITQNEIWTVWERID